MSTDGKELQRGIKVELANYLTSIDAVHSTVFPDLAMVAKVSTKHVIMQLLALFNTEKFSRIVSFMPY